MGLIVTMPAITYAITWGATCAECGQSSGIVDNQHVADAWRDHHNATKHAHQLPEGS